MVSLLVILFRGFARGMRGEEDSCLFLFFFAVTGWSPVEHTHFLRFPNTLKSAVP